MVLDTISNILNVSWKIFISPWQHEATLWMILPLVLILFFIHIYFGRYKEEELGWNSAFSNSISLMWICISIVHFLSENYTWKELFSKSQLVRGVILVGILLVWVSLLVTFNFFHKFPKRFAFIVSSSSSVYILAYIVIALLVGGIDIRLSTLISAMILFILMLSALQLIKRIIPGAKEYTSKMFLE